MLLFYHSSYWMNHIEQIIFKIRLNIPINISISMFRYTLQDYVPDRLSELAEALANPIKYQSELDKREHQLAVLTEDMDVKPEEEQLQPRRPSSQPQPAQSFVNILIFLPITLYAIIKI